MTECSYVRKLDGDVKNVVIVYPYTYVNPYTCLPPLAAEYLQAGVLAAGRNVTLLDMRFEDDIQAHLDAADLVCLYGFFEDCAIFGKWKIHVIDEVLAQIPEGTPIVAGGTGFGAGVATLQHYPTIDVVIEGMPDTPIQELLATGTPEAIHNCTWRRGDEVVRNPQVTHRLSEDLYPRRDLRNPRYRYHVLGMGVDLVRAGMGCNYRCRFCYQYGKDTNGQPLRWQGRSAQSQFAELSSIDAPFVLWVDDDMTTDMEALEELSDLLVESGVRKILVGTGRVDHVVQSDVRVLEKLERAGFLGLAFGVESLSDETLRFYRKGQTVEMAERAIGMMSQTNILLFCNFLLGSPGETEADMMEFLEFGRRWNVDTLVTNRLRVPEGSILHSSMYDPATGEPRPGMERIQGPQLKRIKYAIKYGQRSPLRLALSILKLNRHRGLFVDPLYLVCCAIETLTKHTWIEKTRLVPVLLFVPKRLATFRWFRATTRAVAGVLSPPLLAITKVTESIDRRIGLSTTLMPGFVSLFRRKVLDKQKARAQFGTGRASQEAGKAGSPTARAVVR